MNVQANGTPVGTLTLVDPEIQFYSLTIKAAANSAPILKLHFSFSPVPNPTPVDSQPRQIALARLALVPLGHPVEQPAGTTDRADAAESLNPCRAINDPCSGAPLLNASGL